jgi:hypothetical protein
MLSVWKGYDRLSAALPNKPTALSFIVPDPFQAPIPGGVICFQVTPQQNGSGWKRPPTHEERV